MSNLSDEAAGITDDHIRRVCDDFKTQWLENRQPRIEDYVAKFSSETQSDGFAALLEQELQLLKSNGESPRQAAYAQRFPEYGDVVAKVFLKVVSGPDTTEGNPDQGTESFRGPLLQGESQSEFPFAAGEVVGEYTIESVIDQGSFGVVYRARHQRLDRSVALKVAKPEHFIDEEHTQRFLQEARTVAKLEHAGIVSAYDCGVFEPHTPYVAMQLVDGETLAQRMHQGAMDWRQASELAATVAEALAFAHERGIVHRDLKPANILIDSAGKPLVADFGLALHYDRQASHENEFAGTIAYMSPEQVRREAHWLDGRTDLWSLGVILYEMLTNRHPFRSKDRVKRADEILGREPWPLRQIDPTLPVEIERVVNKCLRKNVADRFASAMDLAAALRELRAETGGVVSEPGPLVAPSGNTHSGIGVLALCSAGVVVVLLVLGFLGGAFLARRYAASSVSNAKSTIATQDDAPVDENVAAGQSPPSAANAENTPTAVATVESPLLSRTLDVLIWNLDDPQRRGISIHEPGALPFREGDQVRLNVSLNRPAYIYLAWIDSEAHVSPVFPWEPGKWETRPAKPRPNQTISLPEAADHGWELVGAAGMETLVVLARSTPLPENIALQPLFDGLPVQPMQDPRAIAWFKDGRLITAKQDSLRAPNFVDEKVIDDPLLQAQRLLYERLSEHFELVEAVSFAKQGG